MSWHGHLVAAGMGKGSGVPQPPRCLSLVPHDGPGVVGTGGQGAERGLVAAAWGRAQPRARGGDLSRRNRAVPSLIQGTGWVTGGPGVSGFCKHQPRARAEPSVAGHGSGQTPGAMGVLGPFLVAGVSPGGPRHEALRKHPHNAQPPRGSHGLQSKSQFIV